jgi:hypothetical protein
VNSQAAAEAAVAFVRREGPFLLRFPGLTLQQARNVHPQAQGALALTRLVDQWEQHAEEEAGVLGERVSGTNQPEEETVTCYLVGIKGAALSEHSVSIQ